MEINDENLVRSERSRLLDYVAVAEFVDEEE